jgi:outer membrane protein TolC
VHPRPNQYFFTEQDQFNGNWEGGLVLRWTLLNGGQRHQDVQQARARLQQAEARLSQARDDVIMDVSRQYLLVEQSMEAATVAAQYVGEAEEALRVVRQHFAEGVALSADVLDAEQVFRTAQSRRAQAETSYATAHAALLHALGRAQ